MYQKSFIVDLNREMFKKEDKTILSVAKPRQLLICSCGHNHFFDGKVKRSVVTYSGETVEQIEGKETITCAKCDKQFPQIEKPILLEPDKKQILSVEYSFNEIVVDNSKILKRKRTYVVYLSAENKLLNESYQDEIIFNEQTKKVELYINPLKFRGTNSNLEAANDKKKISNIVTLKTLNDINVFFEFQESVDYEGLNNAFLFLKSFDYLIKDLPKIKEQSFIGEFYNSFEIHTANNKKYRCLDSGFGDGSKIRVELNNGIYLKSLLEMAKVFFCISKFENLSTIFLTKGYNFFINYIQNDSLILNEATFKKENATYPAKILELSFNNIESKEIAVLKANNDQEENFLENESLKFSQNIYNNIKKTDEIIILNGVYKKGFINKSEIESLFLEYERKDIFSAFEMLAQPFQKKVNITLRHIKHLIKHKIYKDYTSDNFMTEYIDTISIIEQIVAEKGKVEAKLKRDSHKLSKAVIDSYNKFLRIKEGIFFDIRTKSDLKKMHDRLSAIHSIFQDEEKAEKYIQIAEKHTKYNDTIDHVTFLIMPTAQDIYHEHFTMNHCIQTYINSMVKEEYIAMRVKDTISNERATMGININNGVFKFNQLKGYKNSRATSFLIDVVKKYLKKHKINLDAKENNVDLQPDSKSIERMDDYVNEDNVKKKLEKN